MFIQTHACTNVHAYICMHTYACIHMHAYICMHTYACLHKQCTSTHTSCVCTHKHTCLYTCMYAHTCMCIQPYTNMWMYAHKGMYTLTSSLVKYIQPEMNGCGMSSTTKLCSLTVVVRTHTLVTNLTLTTELYNTYYHLCTSPRLDTACVSTTLTLLVLY